ncbi:MAG TPA: hypothetical protein VK886_06210 [Vicinamibacterales bacterium]|nr:hypothetical protein [Vicinamibacterales bacterium]
MPYAWDPVLLEALASLGVQPGPDTSPAVVKDFVTELYQYELRRLRGRLLAGGFPKTEYAGLVASLRPRYWMLSIPAAEWASATR